MIVCFMSLCYLIFSFIIILSQCLHLTHPRMPIIHVRVLQLIATLGTGEKDTINTSWGHEFTVKVDGKVGTGSSCLAVLGCHVL